MKRGRGNDDHGDGRAKTQARFGRDQDRGGGRGGFRRDRQDGRFDNGKDGGRSGDDRRDGRSSHKSNSRASRNNRGNRPGSFTKKDNRHPSKSTKTKPDKKGDGFLPLPGCSPRPKSDGVPKQKDKKSKSGSKPRPQQDGPIGIPCMLIMHPILLGIFVLTTGHLVRQALCLTDEEFFVGGWSDCCKKMQKMVTDHKSIWWISNAAQDHLFRYPFHQVADPISRCFPQLFTLFEIYSAKLHTSLVEGATHSPRWISDSFRAIHPLQPGPYLVKHARDDLPPMPTALPLAWILGTYSEQISPPTLLFLCFGFIRRLLKTFSSKCWPYLDPRTVLLSMERFEMDDKRLTTLSYPNIIFAAVFVETHLDLAKGITRILCLLFPWFMSPSEKEREYKQLKKPDWAKEEAQDTSLARFLKPLYTLCTTTWSIVQGKTSNKTFNGLKQLLDAMEYFKPAVQASLSWVCVVVRPMMHSFQSNLKLELVTAEKNISVDATVDILAAAYFRLTPAHFLCKQVTYGVYLYSLSHRVETGFGTLHPSTSRTSLLPKRAFVQERGHLLSCDVPKAQQLVLYHFLLQFFNCPECSKDISNGDCGHEWKKAAASALFKHRAVLEAKEQLAAEMRSKKRPFKNRLDTTITDLKKASANPALAQDVSEVSSTAAFFQSAPSEESKNNLDLFNTGPSSAGNDVEGQGNNPPSSVNVSGASVATTATGAFAAAVQIIAGSGAEDGLSAKDSTTKNLADEFVAETQRVGT